MSILISPHKTFPLDSNTPDEQLLRWRIEAHPLDEPDVPDPFSARLAREQRWSAEFTRRVIVEYKRFVLLAVTPPRAASPSDAVDQVWHLHLSYTRDYWDKFCGRVLERPLHHAPGSGAAAERLGHLKNYAHTLERYQQVFGEQPPPDIWPPVARRFGPQVAATRVYTRENVIVPRRSLRRGAAIGFIAASGLFLFAIIGGQGLALATLYFGGGACAFVWIDALLSSRLDEGEADGPALQAYEAAFLAGGDDTVVDAMIANLIARGSLSLGDAGRVEQAGALFRHSHPLESQMYLEVGRLEGKMALSELQRFGATRTSELSTRLHDMGLLESASAPFLLALAFPVLLLLAGLFPNQGIGWAVFGVVVGFGVAWSRFQKRRGVTALGNAALAGFRREHGLLNDIGSREQVMQGGLLPAIIALSDLAALRRFELGELADALILARLPTAPDACNGCGC